MATKRNRLSGGTEGGTPLDGEAEATATELRNFIRRMTPAGALKAKREMGILIPLRLLDLPAVRRWGYRCSQCQGVAFEFQGEQFAYFNEATGKIEHSDRPPLGIPLEELPWVQDEMKHRKTATSVLDLRCQHCNQRIALNSDRSLKGKRIVRLMKKGPQTRSGRGTPRTAETG
jgi:hypothetical protein